MARVRTRKPATIFETVDTLMGAIPWTDRRTVLVFHRWHGNREYIQLRTFIQHRTKRCWYPTGRCYSVPVDVADSVCEGMLAASSYKQFTEPPDWYEAFERQYRIFQRSRSAEDDISEIAQHVVNEPSD